MTTRDFVRQYKIGAASRSVKPTASRAAEWPGASHWSVTLWRVVGGKRKRLTTPFSMGSGHSGKPDPATVLDSIASDVSGVKSARGLADWAGDYDQDPHDPKVQNTYRACKKEERQLLAFLGADLVETLLYNTERL